MLLTHTSGITYGFDTRGVANKVDRIFNEKLRACPAAKKSLATFAEDFLPSVPLIFQPGSSWFYGYNTDVLGRIVEIVSGMSLEAFLRSRIFEKIGMTDTSFFVPAGKRRRFASTYMRKGQKLGMLSLGQSRGSDRGLRNIDALLKKFETMSDPLREEASGAFMSGGGGLVGTVADYCAFCECMRNGGRPILSPRAVRFMMTNHLGTPDTPDRDLFKMQRTLPFYDDKSYTEMGMPGTGFGLGFAVTMREELCPYMVSNGSASWGGAASTLFWIDRKERLTVVFATQFRFRDDLRMPLRATLSNLVYGALRESASSRL
eukprot:g3017.t1